MVTPSPIVSAAALHHRLDDPDLRVIDVRWVLGAPGRGLEAYHAGHIPSAVFLDVDTDLVAAEGPGRHPLPSPGDFCRRLEQVGIGMGHDVVAYDDVGGWVAARLWWMLDNLGHERVAVLDGGYQAWLAESFPVTTDVPSFPDAHLDLAASWSRTIDRDSIADRLGRVVLLDARAGPRYRGETEPIDPVPGHIPTARNAPIDGNIGPDGRLLGPAELAARFRALGADGTEGPVVTSCGSGVSACFNSLAMRIAGLPDPILYPGSYSDWSRSGKPVAVGPEPGSRATKPQPVSSSPQAFSTLALLYLVTNARVGSGLRRRRVQRVMTRPEREAVTAVLERLPATVTAWSDGLATLESMHIVEVRRPLTSLSSSGKDRWWAGPRDCREELAEHASEPGYDSVIVLWPSVPDLQLCGWGCTVGPSDATLGAGFSSIASDHWPTLATDPDPEQGYVHEWLHQVEAVYRALGIGDDELPGLHDAADYTSTRTATEAPFGGSYADYHDGAAERPGARTWAPWYRDWMTGRLRRLSPTSAESDDSPALGLTPERWARRSI